MVKKHWILGHLNDVIDSLVAGVSVNSGEDDASGNFFIIKTSAISKGKLNLSEKKPVLPREVARLKCSLRQETILISRMNTPELVGECAYVPCDDPRIYLPDRIWQTNFKKDVDVSAKWLNYLLSSKKYRSLIQNCATGTSNSMKNISKEQLLGLEILYPSFREQTSIAEALSDVDSLISSQQKLIEKKKAIKQGAMQELLTGKKRLPGFSEEWAYRRVGEICSITKGQIITEKTAIHGNVPVIAGGKTPAFYHNVANRESDVITISASGANAGYIAYHDYPIFASDCSTIESSDQYDVKFIYYALLYHQQELIGMQTGGAQPHIHPKEIGVLLVPRINQEEQRAIANVLSDMDSEIEQLEKKLAKYQQIKQGMMQELLTGRIRLV